MKSSVTTLPMVSSTPFEVLPTAIMQHIGEYFACPGKIMSKLLVSCASSEGQRSQVVSSAHYLVQEGFSKLEAEYSSLPRDQVAPEVIDYIRYLSARLKMMDIQSQSVIVSVRILCSYFCMLDYFEIGIKYGEEDAVVQLPIYCGNIGLHLPEQVELPLYNQHDTKTLLSGKYIASSASWHPAIMYQWKSGMKEIDCESQTTSNEDSSFSSEQSMSVAQLFPASMGSSWVLFMASSLPNDVVDVQVHEDYLESTQLVSARHSDLILEHAPIQARSQVEAICPQGSGDHVFLCWADPPDFKMERCDADVAADIIEIMRHLIPFIEDQTRSETSYFGPTEW